MASQEKRKYDEDEQNELIFAEETQEEIVESSNINNESPYIVFDCETTGLDEEKDRIIQLAMIKVFPTTKEQMVFDRRINPEIPREKQLSAYKIHNISPDKLLEEKSFQFYAQDILEFFNGVQYVIGHNVLFDLEFLLAAFRRLGSHNETETSWVELFKKKDFTLMDTYKMSISAFPMLDRYRLVDVANHLGIESTRKKVVSYSVSNPKKTKQESLKMVTGEGDGLHDAMMDVLVTNEVFSECMEELKRKQPNSNVNKGAVMIDTRYTYRIHHLEIIDKAIINETNITVDEREAIRSQAQATMSSLRYTKGRFLKDLSRQELQSEIIFLKKRNGVADRREIKLRQILHDTEIVS